MSIRKKTKTLKIVAAIATIAGLIFALGVVGKADLEMENSPQICREYKGKIVCYRP